MAGETTPKMHPTKTVRIAGDLSEKLDDILYVLGEASADYLDPLLRARIESDHKVNLPAINAVKKAREKAAEAREAAFANSLETGGEG